ncbi:MAG: type I restriction enzyme HsdR N-terminal domain-containing protein [Muribaculaceae bacterium]|mgnify:CR=1 FL=1|jgi:hypothetical protein|nr:type I restriction enzyme HsdR N-terminal domain-containing protein [Muribaculaceae bacterium]MEE0976015.1 type I restriction enzyme HsdR N-terminal domain-containing protein [Muribaculaceae bacterium]
MLKLNLPTFDYKINRTRDGLQIYDRLRRKFVALTPEEWVRQHFVEFIITHKGFPQSLIANEIGITLNNTRRRCDTVVYDNTATPLVIIEYKAPSVEITQATFDQIVRYNMVLQAKYLIVSNGLNHYCCSIDYTNQTYQFLKEIPSYSEL